jgi:hypothetical protein
MRSARSNTALGSLSALGAVLVLWYILTHADDGLRLSLPRLVFDVDKQLSRRGYTSLIAIGDSYTDNGHDRPAQYSGASMRPNGGFGRRWSDGPVAVEYVAEALMLPLHDYAYGGAGIDLDLPGSPKLPVPDTQEQVKVYQRESLRLVRPSAAFARPIP